MADKERTGKLIAGLTYGGIAVVVLYACTRPEAPKVEHAEQQREAARERHLTAELEKFARTQSAAPVTLPDIDLPYSWEIQKMLNFGEQQAVALHLYLEDVALTSKGVIAYLSSDTVSGDIKFHLIVSPEAADQLSKQPHTTFLGQGCNVALQATSVQPYSGIYARAESAEEARIAEQRQILVEGVALAIETTSGTIHLVP